MSKMNKSLRNFHERQREEWEQGQNTCPVVGCPDRPKMYGGHACGRGYIPADMNECLKNQRYLARQQRAQQGAQR